LTNVSEGKINDASYAIVFSLPDFTKSLPVQSTIA